ncbi:LVIVD repeat-containing protein [Natrinema pellirubrum DSM 15624]|uniref:LVIVD repeat-containing protein n=1 Tax=Natrinema pellirubrum (strain DSM 15624 / CIP 106293 / JCM 10476 / NCIMB 786 / 157) TaxID=797303 RepID=L9YL78_NATP1|nr:LVIVD repeat-containing protein [Natrinema pellirubrum DSM 15624]
MPVEAAAEAVVGDGGETAYLATMTGFATVDVSDPTDPTVLVDREVEIGDRPLSNILDVSVDGDRLVVAGPANFGYEPMGFRCYDVSDPADPIPAGEYETGYHIHNCYLEGDLLFVAENDFDTDTNALAIFDVADGIERIGSWSLLDRDPGWRDRPFLGRYLHDVYVQDDLAYLPYWNAGTYLVDVSDPTAPEYVSHVADTTLEAQQGVAREDAVYGLPGNDHYAAVDDTGDLMAVGREAWATSGDPDRPGGIDLYDVSDTAEPVHRGSIDPPRADDETYAGRRWTTSHNFEFRDGRLYSSWYRGGVKIHDVSDPSEPEELTWWRDADETAFWTAQVLEPGETFVASSTEAIPRTSLDGALYTFPIERGTTVVDDGFDADSPSNGSESDGADDSVPGFTGAAALVGGAAGLEWLRRRGNGNVQD